MAAPYFNFRELRRFLVPRWLTDGEGGLVGYALDLMRDVLMERVRLGHLVRFPQQDANGTPGPTDALHALGRDRGVVRGIGEDDTTYAYRLTQWLVDSRTRGTAFTMMKQLADYCDYAGAQGCSFRTVDNRGNWYSRAADGTESSSLDTGNWDWDGDADKWARFWVVIYPGTRWAAEGVWDTGALWDETSLVWGSTATQEHATTLLSIISDWKPAGTRGFGILAFDSGSFDPTAPEPDGDWGKPYEYAAGTAIESRLTTARYIGA